MHAWLRCPTQVRQVAYSTCIGNQPRRAFLFSYSETALPRRGPAGSVHSDRNIQATMADNKPSESSKPEWNEYNARWENIWSGGVQPGQHWDVGQTSAALHDVLKSGRVSAAGKTALVPGCGRGYDVLALAEAGAAVAVGLELAPTAIEAANQLLQSHASQLGERSTAVHFMLGNFFTFQHEHLPFDIGYDYTFGCAMEPSMREQWAVSWARAIKQGGMLVTLLYPVDPSRDPNQGPPFPVTPELYRSLLEPAGFTCTSMEPVPAESSPKARAGKEYLAVWRRT